MVDKDQCEHRRDQPAAQLDETLREAWPVAGPDDAFADRVAAAWQEERAQADRTAPPHRRPTRSARRWSLLAASAAAAVLLIGLATQLQLPDQGAAVASQRTELALGHRATAVAEAGADLQWRVRLGGATSVQQRAGDVFYRVRTGTDFRVETPAGTITVRGTCFRVEVSPMEQPMKDSAWKPRAQGAVVGAAIGAAVILTVYEGKVLLASEGTELALGAGEAARATTAQAPQRIDGTGEPAPMAARLQVERRALQGRVDALEAQLRSFEETGANDPGALAAENKALRTQLTEATRALDSEQALRRHDEGEATPFPDDLDEKYQEHALMKAFREAIAAAKIKGDVTAIDCAEYPCLVFGELDGAADSDVQAAIAGLEQRLQASYPEETDDMRVMVARVGSKNDQGEDEFQNTFSVAITPSAEGEDGDPALAKRIRHRTDQYFRAGFPD